MRSNRRFKTALLIVVLSLVGALPSTAATLFSQPYAGPFQGWVSDSAQGQYVADDFTLLTASVLTDFHWWGGYTLTPDPATAPADNFSLVIYPDLASLQSFSGGASVSLTNLTRTSIGASTPLGNAIFEYSADFAAGLALGPGTYYALLYGNAVGTQRFGWQTIPAGDTQIYTGVWSAPGSGQAFEVTGHAVPEPATLFLVGLGLLAGTRRLSSRP